MIEILKHIS